MYSKSDRLTAMIEALIKAMVRLLRHIGLVDQSGNNTFWTYDDEGRLIRESQTGSLDNLYTYDERGDLFRTGTDVNTNGVLDLASMDRIQEQWREYVQSGGNWFLQRTTISYPFDGSAAPFTNSITRTQVGGSGCACEAGLEETVDARGNVSTRQTSVDPLSKTVTKTLTRPGIANPETTVTSNSLLQTLTLPTGAEYRYLYDGLERQAGLVDPRTGTNRTVYLSNGRVDFTEDAAGYRTAYAYDAATGRRTGVTDALTNTVHTAYDLQGRATNVWGATYPVAYEYDAYGRLSAMKTWRDTNEAPDATRWNYDEATGLLTNKLYADGHGSAYQYDAAGRLTQRTWARGVETAYAYDALGQLTNINYSDATPDVAFTYDRLGRQKTVTDGTGTRTNVYDALALLEEQMPDGAVLSRSYDSLGRPASIALGEGYAIGYGYDEFGRFVSVAVSNGVQFDYSYVPNSTLLAGWSVLNGAAAAYAYEPNRDLKTAVINTFDGSLVSTFAYDHDAAGRRTVRIDGAATPPARTNTFGYNARSELTSAVMPAPLPAGGTNSYAYAYDPIGNRREASANEVTNLYQANELNQYTNINAGAAEPVYDPDGNMTQLGPWAYDWDGENRLISVSSNGVPVMQNQYDYMSRRIMKATATQTNTFLYDGWNMIQESTVSDLQSHVSHFVWGLDLSGSLQGAGGVGGLLARVRRENIPRPLYYACDANGNITDVLDKNGALAAHYEYDPYGNAIAKSGNYAALNPFRFSTKYYDDETELYYYGYRYYGPSMGRWLNRDPLDEALEASLSEASDDNAYYFAENDPITEVDALGLYTFEELPSVYVPVADLLGAIGGVGITAHQLSIEKPLKIKHANCCCSVEQPESYKQTVQISLPSLRSRSAGGAWVVGSTRSGVKRHEKKHVKIWKHYGRIWQQFENWQTKQSASGNSEAECQAKLIAHLQACGSKASYFFNTKTDAAHSALDAAEGWRIVQGWVPAWWYPDGHWPWYRLDWIFEVTGNWRVRLDPVKLDCQDMKCSK